METTSAASRSPHRLTAVLLAYLVLLLLAVFGGATAVRAQESKLSWSVQPSTAAGPDSRAHFIFDVSPGDTIVDYVQVKNLSEQPLRLSVYASDAFNTRGGGFDLLAADKKPVDVGSWVTFDNGNVTLPPAGTANLRFSLKVPANATPGDHPGGIVASLARAASDASGNQVQVDYRVGARIYLRVKGTLAPALQIEDFKVNYDGTLNPIGGGTARITYTVTNTGNVRLGAEPELNVSGPLGIGLRTVTLDGLTELLPGQTQTGEAIVEDLPPAFRLNAKLALSPHSSSETEIPPVAALASSASMWALPLTQVPILAGIVAVGAGFFQRRRVSQREREAVKFPPEVVQAVMKHMNEEHADHALAICKGLANEPAAAHAVTTGVDRDGIDFLVVAGGSTKPVRVPFGRRLRDQAELRGEIVRMYGEASRSLGIQASAARPPLGQPREGQ